MNWTSVRFLHLKILLKIKGFSFRFLLSLISSAYCSYFIFGFCNILEQIQNLIFPFEICYVREISLSLSLSHLPFHMYINIQAVTVIHIPTSNCIMLEENHNTFVLLALKLKTKYFHILLLLNFVMFHFLFLRERERVWEGRERGR